GGRDNRGSGGCGEGVEGVVGNGILTPYEKAKERIAASLAFLYTYVSSASFLEARTYSNQKIHSVTATAIQREGLVSEMLLRDSPPSNVKMASTINGTTIIRTGKIIM